MSTSDLYSVYKTKTRHLAEFRNGWGTAPIIWGYFCKKYLGWENTGWMFGNNNSRLWNLIDNPNIPRDERIIHAFTFDRAICPNNRISEFANACFSVYNKVNDPSKVNHWYNIGEFLKHYKPYPRSLGVGLSCTSVSDSWISWDITVKREKKVVWDIFSKIGE